MKKQLLTAILALTAVAGFAQTNTQVLAPPSTNASSPTNLLGLLGGGGAGQQLWSDIENVFDDAQPYITNDIVNLDVVGLYDKSLTDGKFGVFSDVNVPMTQQSAIGFGAGYINRTFMDATVNLKLGTTFNYPFIGKVYNWAGSGPDYNFKVRKIGAWNALGAQRTWSVWSSSSSKEGLNLSANVGVANESTVPGVMVLAGPTLSLHW